MVDPITIVIPATRPHPNLPGQHRPFLRLNEKETLFSRLVRQIRHTLPQAKILLLLPPSQWYSLPGGTVLYHRPRNNPSLIDVLQQSRPHIQGRLLLIMGDLLLAKGLLEGLPRGSFLLGDQRAGRKEEIGLNGCAGRVEHLAYGVETKWGQIAGFAGQELAALLAMLDNHEYWRRYLLHELLNKIIGAGGAFTLHQTKQPPILEIDSPQDFQFALRQAGKF